MSGSHDRPTRPAGYPPIRPAPQFDPYDDPTTGPPTGYTTPYPTTGHPAQQHGAPPAHAQGGAPRPAHPGAPQTGYHPSPYAPQPAAPQPQPPPPQQGHPNPYGPSVAAHTSYAPQPHPQPAPYTPPFEHDPYGQPQQPAPAVEPLEAPPHADIYAPAREADTAREAARTTPIVPPASVTGRSLTLVVSIMCFLACLTAGAVYLMNRSANAWLKDIASEVTVQVEPREKVDTDKLVKDVAGYLGKQKGIAGVRPLSLEDSSRLLEPWLGNSDALKMLPVPRLIALDVDRGSPPDFDALRKDLQAQFKSVSLDDHRHWQQQIRTVTRSFALGGIAILALVAAATMAIIISATKSSMASNREIVEVLHFVGATDRFIAREFERHFLRLGIRAGLVGALFAMAVFVLMPTVMELLGGGTVTMAEMRRLVGAGALDAAGFVLLGIVVVVIAALCMVTSRLGVYRILNSQH